METTTTAARLIRKWVVEEMTGLTARSIDSKVAEGRFPKPVLLDARQCAWIAARVLDRDTGYMPPGRAAILDGRKRGGVQARRKQKAAAVAAREMVGAE
jgi:predicted DNA-binding transcriptional regulator AlpA